MLFFVDIFQSYAAYCVPFVENRADLMLQNANAVLRSVHRQVWLHVALLLSQRVFEQFFVWFACSLMPVLPQCLDSRLVCCDGKDELHAHCGFTIGTKRSIVSKPSDMVLTVTLTALHLRAVAPQLRTMMRRSIDKE
ncbi:hypothetical protein TNCV_623061 [Trichonephila clavipes]|nr:hypothetical protein TNCV_623061 [Trichonephila clavipes]